MAQVAIGISTRNRWEDLRDTLHKISDFGLGDLQVLIFDDASDSACPFDVASICRRAELKRFSESRGYIVRRNQLAQEMDSKYYLSLDDDSFPVSGSLQAAIDFAESCDDLFCLNFPVYNPVISDHQVKSIQDRPYQVRSFIGCGHLLHRRRFLDIGGYREELVHQGEEVEIAARAFHHGLRCYHFPGLQVHHLVSNAGRSWHRMDFYSSRNSALWNDWYMPRQLKAIKQGRTFISRIVHSIKVRRLGQVKGQLVGLREIRRYKANRRPMSLKLYREWNSLPSL